MTNTGNRLRVDWGLLGACEKCMLELCPPNLLLLLVALLVLPLGSECLGAPYVPLGSISSTTGRTSTTL